MKDENINKQGNKIQILVAPLDWGLGHATRCIPLIYTLQNLGASVILAAEGATAALLHNEFPEVKLLTLKGYRISYSKNKSTFFLKLLSQVPGIYFTIMNENKWLNKIVKEYSIDAVISDNRFGLYHKQIPCVYITHQLYIETGIGSLNRLLQKIHYKFINRFTQCWVPDAAGQQNLAGKLSHPQKLPLIPVKYLGILSRFKKQEQSILNDLLILLSGPEPQRTIFENILLKQLKNNSQAVVLVRGLPLEKKTIIASENLKIINHLSAGELSKYIQQSKWILARAGYSTIMDLAALQKKAILVPTPGQGEQEYLAKYLKQKNLFYTCAQQNFLLKVAIQNAESFSFEKNGAPNGLDEQIIYAWLAAIKKTTA